MAVKKLCMNDPPGMLTYEEWVIPFFLVPFFGASWTVSWGPGLVDRIIMVATRPLRFDASTADGVEFAKIIRRNLLK